MSQQSARPHRSKGPRPKHIPQRMCISCREKSAKRALVRIVRTPEGTVEIDPTGKRNGRGAYLCDDPVCWARVLKSGSLAQALKTTIDTETTNTLARYAAGLTPAVNPAPDVPSQEGITG